LVERGAAPLVAPVAVTALAVHAPSLRPPRARRPMHRRNANDSASRILPRTVMVEPVTVEKFAVGQSVRRLEDPHLVQGLGRYADDVTLPRQAWGVVVRSPHAHARIRRIDVT